MQHSGLRKEFADILQTKLKMDDKRFHNEFQSKQKNPYAERVCHPHDFYRDQLPTPVVNLRR